MEFAYLFRGSEINGSHLDGSIAVTDDDRKDIEVFEWLFRD
jgi:hypothetical protein